MMFRLAIVSVVLALTLTVAGAPAVLAQTPVDAPALQLSDAEEARAQALMRTFACVVCEGQSIADSDAEAAARMRTAIRQDIANGLSDDAIRQRMTNIYGDGVLLDPPATGVGAALWLAPLALLALGLFVVANVFRRSPANEENVTPRDR